MNSTITLSARHLMLVGLLGLIAVLTFGFAATNQVDPSNAGDGSGAISGYTASNIHYTLDASNPANATSVSFNIAPPLASGGTSRVSFNNGSTWLSCTGTSTLSCSGTIAIGATATSLRVIAAQ